MERKLTAIMFTDIVGYSKVMSTNEKIGLELLDSQSELVLPIIKNFNGKIINIHPSLLPKFKGLNTFSRMLENKEKKGGCTVHYVNEKLDSGGIIIQKNFEIKSKDDEKILKTKTQKLEYRAFPEAIIKIFRNI